MSGYLKPKALNEGVVAGTLHGHGNEGRGLPKDISSAKGQGE